MIRVNLLQAGARPPRLQQIDNKSTFGSDSSRVPIPPYLAIRTLAVKEEELNRSKRSLEHVNSELVRTNHALSVLASRIKEGRQELMKEIAVTIASRILPAIDEIAQCRRPESLMLQLDVVRVLVKGLLPDSIESASIIPVLSRGEMRVAIMIKNDLRHLTSPDCFTCQKTPLKLTAGIYERSWELEIAEQICHPPSN